jgi:MarR family transcriptional regulator, lower aerobic nicotinate degradation pathway regulator
MAAKAARRARSSKQDVEPADADGLAQISFIVMGALGRRASAAGLSIIQTRLLGVLRDRTPSINQLSKLLEVDKSSVSGLVDRAEARGLVRRVQNPADRRSVQVALTREGRSLGSGVARGFEADVAEMLEGLSPAQRGSLSRLLSRVVGDYADTRGVDISVEETGVAWDRR